VKAVIQAVHTAAVWAEGELTGKIGRGMTLLLGVSVNDTEKEVKFLAKKAANLRIFKDAEDKLNLSVKDIGGGILVVSNFTLCANSEKGNRPSYIEAARPEQAEPLYEMFKKELAENGVDEVACGRFGAEMRIMQENDGPTTIILDTDVIMK